ncbi:MAG TPA: GNAT family N-acetyltransferase [Acidocella sp.]|nr:GNAT family N-acetyltransferase [Acidocella sp.]
MTQTLPLPVVIHEYPASAAQFAVCMAIRLAVFVQEQQVPLEDERDALDDTARHFLASGDGQPVGTARLLMQPDGTARIGRVAVLAACRGRGVGAALMRHIEDLTTAPIIVLDAQTRALPFYQGLGYEPSGEVFLEAGIPHRHMRKVRRSI